MNDKKTSNTCLCLMLITGALFSLTSGCGEKNASPTKEGWFLGSSQEELLVAEGPPHRVEEVETAAGMRYIWHYNKNGQKAQVRLSWRKIVLTYTDEHKILTHKRHTR